MSIEFLKTNYEKIDYLSNLLKSRATGKEASDSEYKALRDELLSNRELEQYFPIWLKTNGDLNSFWRFIKEKFKKYDERTKFLSDEFLPLLNYLMPTELKPVLIPKVLLPSSKDILKQELNEYIKIHNEIINIYGSFILTTNVLGNGGTSVVKGFNFSGKEYAIKFLLENIKQKESTTFKRFKQAHLNLLSIQHSGVVLPQIHFDSIEINNETKIPYIIMPKAETTLKVFVDEKKRKDEFNFTIFKNLFNSLINIVDIIHNHNIIHRDIKPENLFIVDERLVLGDFDIAKFNDDEHIKLVDTKKGDRMANFYYSAPEQSIKRFDEITFSADWYAIGQVLYWLITGDTLRGQENISLVQYDKQYEEYEALIRNLLSNEPSHRLSSKKDIEIFLDSKKQITWEDTLHNFDDIIVYKYMSDFGVSGQGFKEFNDVESILEIMTDLSDNTDKLALWISQGYSDRDVKHISKDKSCDTCYLIEYLEIKIKTIWIYKHFDSFGGSTIIIETDNYEPINTNANKIDYYGLFDGNIIKPEEVDSGWAIISGKRTKLDRTAGVRERVLNKTIYFLAPKMGPLVKNDKVIDMLFKTYDENVGIDENFLKPLKLIKRHDKVMLNA